MTVYFKKVTKGFTLIELLIVMAILGVLAVVVLVAINPVQQLARTRDAGRKSGVAQLGHALEAYYTSRNGSYVPPSTTWISNLTTSGELSTIPAAIQYSIAGSSVCSNAPQQSWCYNSSGGYAVVYVPLESTIEKSKCLGGESAWFAYRTAEGRAGLICGTEAIASNPAAGSSFYSNQ
jgi:prepilin-type N-terminal cleavage/methylation domain-containing protein